jgi:hypothetical protein
MRNVTFVIAAFLLPAFAAPMSQRRAPEFADYPTSAVPYHGPVAQPSFSTLAGSARFRTLLRQGMAGGPNFAGEWVVTTWGCGTSCVEGAMVNAHTGWICWLPQSSNRGAQYRVDSRLLIVNPVAVGDQLSGYEEPFTWYFEWMGDRFRLVDSIPAPRDSTSLQSAGTDLTATSKPWRPCTVRARF